MKDSRLALALVALAVAACSKGPQSAETAAASPQEADGKNLFAANCGACHIAAAPGTAAAKMQTIGPNLWGVVGRPSASTDYDYSPAMKAANLTWDEATLDRYLENPQMMVPSTRMAFPGLSDTDERKAIIAYLKTQG
ncbi:MAG TPA: c-type cytochrome [Parvularculaceae bacterium]|nr:c-type cytochrome [Parvularculaceae bacterium]